MHHSAAGKLHVICGPMFAGKTEELLRRVRRARLAGQSVEVINHVLDARHGSGDVASHTGLRVPAHAAQDSEAITELVTGSALDLLAIDEAQFFGPDLVSTVDALRVTGATVVVSGLCVTFEGRPFEPLPSLMAVAEEVVKLTAVCAVCGRDAAFHQRSDRDPEDVRGSGDARTAHAITAEHIGGIESYQARCRRHFTPE